MGARTRTARRSATPRRTLGALALFGIVGIGVLAGALPAAADDLALSGVTECRNGEHVITWTIANTQSTQAMTITSAMTAKDPASYDVTGYAKTLAVGATTHGTTVIPGNVTGGVTLYVGETWANGNQSTDQTSLNLGEACEETTTTTTVMSTTTLASTSTTTVAVAGSTEATTAAASSTTVAATAQLPRTGTNNFGGAIAGSVMLLLGALALTLSGRKRHAR